MKSTKAVKATVVGGLCAIAGAAAGISGSAAATSTHKRASSRSGASAQHAPRGGGRSMPVHEDAVVLDKAGTAFITVTEDSGTVTGVAGDQLTIKEGTSTVAYKTVTLTIPAGAKVSRNFATATLGDVKVGDKVHVSQSSDGTAVAASDGTVKPPRGGPGGPGRRGGPPPMG